MKGDNEIVLGTVLFLVLFTTLALTESKPSISVGDIVNPLATLIAAYAGAWSAFKFQAAQKQEEENKNCIAAGNRALSTLMQQINTLKLIQVDFIDPVRNHPLKHFLMRPNLQQESNLSFDLKSLDFLAQPQYHQILFDLTIEEARYRESIKALNARSRHHIDVVMPLCEAAGMSTENEYTDAQFRAAIGERNYTHLKDMTDAVIRQLDRTVESLYLMKEKFRKTMIENYPKGKFINFELLKDMPPSIFGTTQWDAFRTSPYPTSTDIYNVTEELNTVPPPQPSPGGRGSNRENQFITPAIIGGGYAGMAAAATLAEHGIAVTVFESAQQLGGRARGVLYNDTQLDNGQHLLLGCYRQMLRMIEQVGGNIELDFLRLPLQLDLHKQFALRAPRLPAPLHLLIALLTAQGLTWGERYKASRFMLTLRGMNFRLPEDITVAELLAQYGQDADLTLKLWEPLCISALNTPVRKASAQVLLNVLRDALNQSRADSDMLLPRLDFTALFPQRAAHYVEQHGGKVHLSCGVEALRPLEDGIEITSVRGTEKFSHVICATPPVVAAKLLRPIAELAQTVAQIDSLEHQPIYTLYLQYPEHVTLPHAMLGLHQRYSQWLFDKGRISGQHGLLAAVISAEGIHQELSQEKLAQKVIAELREEFGIADQPAWFKVIAEKRATFCCSPNLQRPTQRTPIPRLLLAGDYTAGDYPATLEGAILSGILCTKAIAA